MNKPRILVTSAAGRTGSAVVFELLENCPAFAPNLLEAAMLFALAAEEAKLEVVALMSQWHHLLPLSVSKSQPNAVYRNAV